MKRTLSTLTAGVVVLALGATLSFAGATQVQTGSTPASPAPAKSATATKSTSGTTASSTAAKPAGSSATSSTASKSTSGSAKSSATLVDLNSASKEELMKLPGIGDKISDKIIAGRPWANKSQLVSKGVMNQGAYDKVSKMVIAKQPAKAAPAAPATSK